MTTKRTQKVTSKAAPHHKLLNGYRTLYFAILAPLVVSGLTSVVTTLSTSGANGKKLDDQAVALGQVAGQVSLLAGQVAVVSATLDFSNKRFEGLLNDPNASLHGSDRRLTELEDRVKDVEKEMSDVRALERKR